MKYKLKLPQQLSLGELKQKIKDGDRFIVFQYCITPIFASYTPFSPAILISDKSQTKAYIRRYNWISAIFGWWGVPHGPSSTISALKLNLRGGLDVTDDIMHNISEQDLLNNIVELEETTLLFKRPDKYDVKTLKKICRDYQYDYNLQECYAGWSLESNNCFCLGLKAEKDFQKYAEVFQNKLEKKFYKHIQIEIIDLNNENEIHPYLKKQGEMILIRKKEVAAQY